ncbi:hypothetical protein Tco_0549341 [Tanacetum coccineum]
MESPTDSGIGELISSLGESQNHLMPFQASFGVGGFIEIPWSLVSGEFPISHIMVTRGCLFDKGLVGIFHAILRFSMMLLEHQDIIAEFCGPSRWKELSKETSSKILPCGDGSCWKTFKPIASLIAKGKLK